MKNVGTKFFANPEIAIGGNHHRLNVKVCAGQPTLGCSFSNDPEWHLLIGIRELDKALQLYGTISSF